MTNFIKLMWERTRLLKINTKYTKSEEWSSQIIFQLILSNWKEDAWKNQGFNGIISYILHITK